MEPTTREKFNTVVTALHLVENQLRIVSRRCRAEKKYDEAEMSQLTKVVYDLEQTMYEVADYWYQIYPERLWNIEEVDYECFDFDLERVTRVATLINPIKEHIAERDMADLLFDMSESFGTIADRLDKWQIGH